MAIIGLRSEDPRSDLEAARRWDIWLFAKRNNIAEIKEDMPGDLMKAILKSKGIYSIGVPRKPLFGGAGEPPPNVAAANTTDATADLMRQYEQQSAAPKLPANPRGGEINQLRARCKSLGIKMKRGETTESLRAKLNGEQDAS